MAEGFNVEIISKSQIKYPEECIVCGRNANGQKGKVQVGPLDMNMAFSKKNIVEVPMHNRCSTKYKLTFWKRYGFIFIIGAVVLIALIIYTDYDSISDRLINRIILIIVLSVVLIPILVWHFNRPLPIECEYEKGNYIFTFNNRSYAERFAQINGSKVEKRI